jgi:hypothetical protein
MKQLFFMLLALLISTTQAQGNPTEPDSSGGRILRPAYAICTGHYALCAASATTPTGNLITVNGKKYREGVAVCPVLEGDAVADLSLMNGSCEAPNGGQVWSLFSPQSSYPQAPYWNVEPAKFRKFITTTEPDGGMSNMWSFLCDITGTVEAPDHGVVTLANCYGPINESPWLTGIHVPPGSISFTQAPVDAANPVGGNVPVILQEIHGGQ